jgi:DHA1 family bicyclomycin/chloramphenicol resistance-like MFS transporter
VTLAHALIGWSGIESLALFVALQALAMICFAFCSANLSTLAMEHTSRIAGTASSVQGVVATIGGGLIGLVVGQAFDGTAQPFLWGMAGCAGVGFVTVLLTEPKRLFAGPIRKEEIPPEAAEPPPEF